MSDDHRRLEAIRSDRSDLENHYIDSIVGYDASILSIFSRDVLRRIREKDATWEAMVPPPVAEAIKRRGLFGYSGNPVLEGNK